MNYAVIKTNGKQYRVFENEIINIDKIDKKPGEKIEFPEVLLLVANGKVKIGQPTIPGISIKAKVVDQIKGDKIRVVRFKAKSRYVKTKGFRAQLTKVQIGNFSKDE